MTEMWRLSYGGRTEGFYLFSLGKSKICDHFQLDELGKETPSKTILVHIKSCHEGECKVVTNLKWK